LNAILSKEKSAMKNSRHAKLIENGGKSNEAARKMRSDLNNFSHFQSSFSKISTSNSLSSMTRMRKSQLICSRS